MDGEVAFFDATSSSVSTPSFENFHFLESGERSMEPVSSIAFHRDESNGTKGGQLLLAVATDSTLRVMDGSTYEVFYRFTKPIQNYRC